MVDWSVVSGNVEMGKFYSLGSLSKARLLSSDDSGGVWGEKRQDELGRINGIKEGSVPAHKCHSAY